MANRSKPRYNIPLELREKIIDAIVEKYYELNYESLKLKYKNISELKKVSKTTLAKKKIGPDWSIRGIGGEEYLYQNLFDDKHIRGGKYCMISSMYEKIKKYLGGEVFDKILKPDTFEIDKNWNPQKVVPRNLYSFLYYYFDDKDNDEGISQGLLEVREKERGDAIKKGMVNEVRIKDKAHNSGASLYYKGKSSYIEKLNMFVMDLEIAGTGERKLHIRLHKGTYGKTPPPLLLGQYQNTDQNNSIVSGTLVVQRQKEYIDFDSFEPRFFKKGTNEFPQISDSEGIQLYLSQKLNNRLKTPTGLHSGDQLINHRKDKLVFNKSVTQIKKVFISTPATSICDENDFIEIRDEVLKLKFFLESQFNFICYCALENNSSFKNFEESNVLYNKIERELNDSDLFLMILTHKKGSLSSSYLELGKALERNIFCTIFTEEEKGEDKIPLPNLMRGAIAQKGDHIKHYEFEEFSDISEKIRKGALALFGNK